MSLGFSLPDASVPSFLSSNCPARLGDRNHRVPPPFQAVFQMGKEAVFSRQLKGDFGDQYIVDVSGGGTVYAPR